MEILNESKHWDEVSDGYADFVQPIFKGFVNQYIDHLKLNQSMTVLDLACGPGTASLQICNQVHQVDGLDFSKKMIGEFNKSIKDHQIENIRTHVGDGQDLSRFKDNSFDLVVSCFGLIFFQNRIKALKEIKRVLKPKGEIFISSWLPMMDSSFMRTLSEAVQSTGYMPDATKEKIKDVGTPDPEIFLNEFKEAGFLDVKKKLAKIHVEISDVEFFWQQNIKGSIPLLMLRKDMSKDQWTELSLGALQYLKKVIQPPCELEFQAWVWTL